MGCPRGVPIFQKRRTEVNSAVNSVQAPEPVDEFTGIQPESPGPDSDAMLPSHPGLSLSVRILASLAYISFFSVFIVLTRPRARFIRRHASVALTLFLVRVIWTGVIVSVWWWRQPDGIETSGKLRSLMIDLFTMVTVGAPIGDVWRGDAAPWLVTPVVLSVLAVLFGFLIAIAGRTADIHAFLNADWTDPIPRRIYLGQSPEEEKERARRARERQIERLQKSSRMLRTEQERRTMISGVETQLERVSLQREYHDQLLALGEVSQRRYDQVNADLDEQEARLRSQLSGLETRVQNVGSHHLDSNDGRLRRPSETLVESIAIVTPDGVPIFTYGQFQLDDAIVAGMLSAFDSLSEEVFGSRVHKTSLSEGQVLYFAHGEFVLIMAGFTDEPSPRQIEDLRTMLKQFESANEGPLARRAYDPAYLHEVPIPFRFLERMPRGEPVLPEAL